MKKTFEINTTGHPAGVKIVDGHAVLAIPLKYLKTLVESDEYWCEYDEKNEWKCAKVVDPDEWACDVVSALNQEEEDGSTFITKAIEEAIKLAIEEVIYAISLPND